jgi:4'-phosphopantetheinyl transferase
MTSLQVTIHLVFPEIISQEAALSCLADEEKSRADRFRFRKDAVHWMACRANLRKILGQAIQRPPREVPLVLTENGKPLLAPPYDSLHFNLSHCSDLAIVALCAEGPVGIDLESLDRAPDLLECETTFCHPREISELPSETNARASQLLRIWTAKEAVLKALGTGLSHPPESVRILFGNPVCTTISDRPLAGVENQNLHELHHARLDGYQTFVSAPTSVTRIQLIDQGFTHQPSAAAPPSHTRQDAPASGSSTASHDSAPKNAAARER